MNRHGPEADRHLLRCLFSHVDFSGDGKSSGKDFHQVFGGLQSVCSLRFNLSMNCILVIMCSKQHIQVASRNNLSWMAERYWDFSVFCPSLLPGCKPLQLPSWGLESWASGLPEGSRNVGSPAWQVSKAEKGLSCHRLSFFGLILNLGTVYHDIIPYGYLVNGLCSVEDLV